MSLDFRTVNALVASMGTMKFFPADPDVRLALVEVMGEIAETEEQVRWLVKRMRDMYAEWPGEREMRACFCSRFHPKDGRNVGSTVYPDGLPSEFPQKHLLMLLLPAGAVVSADPELDRAVVLLADSKDLNRVARTPRVSKVPDLPPEKRITQADVERAVAELHEKRARAELGLGG
jgi:hypothetical protein